MLFNIDKNKIYFHRFIVIGFSLFLVGFVFTGTYLIEKAETKRYQSELRSRILSKLSTIRARLEGEINSELLLARSLVSVVSTQPNITKERFQDIVRHFIAASKHMRNIGLAKGTVIKYIYPIKGNEAAIGLDYRKVVSQWSAVKHAIEERKIVVAGPLELVQGGTAIIGRTPFYDDTNGKKPGTGSYLGLVSIVLNMSSIYDAAGLNAKFPYQAAMRGKDGLGEKGEIIFGNSNIFNETPVLLDVTLPNGYWQLAAIPKGGWHASSPDFLARRNFSLIIAIILPALFISQMREIERRRKAEKKLLKLSQAIEHSPTSVEITDSKGMIEYVNPKFTDLTGYTFEEVYGKNSSLFISNDFYIELWDTINKGGIWSGEVYSQKKNGEHYYEKAIIAPIKGENGEISNFIAVKEDITEQKRIQRLRDDVERVVKHDLKNPLSAIIASAEILLLKQTVNEQNKRLLSMIYDSGYHMLNMINNSLDLFKMEEGSYNFEPTRLDLIKILHSLESEFYHLKKIKGLTTLYQLNKQVLDWKKEYLIAGEKIHLKSLFANLIQNALEASPEKSQITISIDQKEEFHRVTIHNFGTIPEEIKDNFFERYSTSGKKGGTGLGTYSAKLIAKVHQGDIEFTSSEKEGTTLTVLLPA